MNFFYRNLSPRHLVVWGLLLPIVLTAIVGWLQWQSVNDMLATRGTVRHTRNTQIALGVFRYSLSDAESCQFRYVLTHDPVNLDLYHKLISTASDQFATLRSLNNDVPIEKANLDKIEPLFNDKIQKTDQSIALEQSGDHAGALQLISADASRVNMLEIESIVDDMQIVENQLLFQRQTSYQHDFKLNYVLSMLSLLLCLGFIMAIFLLLRRLSAAQSSVTLQALSEMLDYEGGRLTIEEYLIRRREALATHGATQVEAERLLGLLEKRHPKTAAPAQPVK